MRAIVLDTETTGFKAREGDRIVEIGCVELVNHVPSGRTFHVHINPERDMPEDAFRVHGLSTEFLRDKPVFAAIADDFLSFIGEDPLIIHNASFDMGFLNMELGRLGKPVIGDSRAIDTLLMACKKFPGAQANLDALCSRFGIDNTRRTKHGALLDSELLAEVYIELIGGRQTSLILGQTSVTEANQPANVAAIRRTRPFVLAPRLDAKANSEHADFIAQMGDNAIWKRYGGP